MDKNNVSKHNAYFDDVIRTIKIADYIFLVRT